MPVQVLRHILVQVPVYVLVQVLVHVLVQVLVQVPVQVLDRVLTGSPPLAKEPPGNGNRGGTPVSV